MTTRLRQLGLRPTHTCFDDALDYADLCARRFGSDALEPILWIMHGICVDPYSGKRIAHGWAYHAPLRQVVQAGRTPLGARQFYGMHARDFDAEMLPQLVTRYRLSEALAQNELHNTFGPWLPEYLELCGHGRCVNCGKVWPMSAQAAAEAELHRAGACLR